MGWFTGTSTGDRYNTGQEYNNSRGGVSVANPNGTFTDVETGVTTAGSYYGNGNASFGGGASPGWTSGEPHYSASSNDNGISRAGSGPGSNGVQTGATGGGTGPGSNGVGPNGPASGGTGPGSRAVVSMGNRGARLGEISFGDALTPELKPTVTQVKVGGDWWQSNPWFSDADEWTARYGEGEIAETLFLLTNVGADSYHNLNRLGYDYLGPRAGAAAGHAHNAVDNFIQQNSRPQPVPNRTAPGAARPPGPTSSLPRTRQRGP